MEDNQRTNIQPTVDAEENAEVVSPTVSADSPLDPTDAVAQGAEPVTTPAEQEEISVREEAPEGEEPAEQESVTGGAEEAAGGEAETLEVSENSLDHWAIENDEDTEEAADEIGVSGDYDAYGREILRDVFENRLRLAPNSVKLSYSKLKNEILSYKGVRRRYVGKEERYYAPAPEGESYGDVIIKFSIEDNALIADINGNEMRVEKLQGSEAPELQGSEAPELQSATAPKLQGEEDSQADSEGENIAERGAKALEPLKAACEAIEKLAEEAGFEKKENYVRIAYAERYPFNPDAVLRGEGVLRAPVEGEFDGPEYEPIDGELMRDLLGELIAEIENKEGKDKLEGLRQEAQTMKDATALTEPIVYFYNVARDNENNVGYVTLQQVLNDKFLGKLLPQQFFAVAEGSKRIETLNLLSIKEAAKAADSRGDLTIVTQASARLLIRDDVLDRLVKAAKTENKNLVLAFDCALLEALGDRGLTGIRKLAENDVKIMIDNTENAGLKVLTEYNIDYLRFDARYYKEEDPRKTAHLDMVLGYAKVQGIKTAAIYVDTVKEARYMLTHGVLNIEGDIVGAPLRILSNAIKQAKRLPVK